MNNRVLMVATVPSMIGQFNMDNIRMLLDMGYQVDVACDFTDVSVWPASRVSQFKKQMELLNIECVQLNFSRSPVNWNRHLNSYRQTIKLIQNRKYSFIHTHTPIASAIVRMAAHKTGTRVIYTAHGFHFYEGAPGKNWIIYYPVEKYLSKYTDVLITINKEDYRRATTCFHAKKTVYIPGVGVDTEKFSVCKIDTKAKRKELGVKDTDFLFLSVGELSKRKNQRVVIDALFRMKKEGSIGNIVYLIAGEGEQESEFKNLIEQYDLRAHVVILGYRTDIDELCETVDCFIHPSIREGLGIAPLEAMAAGLPLISANTNGIKDYTKDGFSGCCIEPTSVDAMIAAMKRIRNDDEFRIQCGANNWKTAKLFDIHHTEAIMRKVYRGGYRHLNSILLRQKKRVEFGLNADDFVIISVGELNENKNHKVIMEAVAAINDKDLKFVIVGTGVLEAQLKQYAKVLGISNRIVFTGFSKDVVSLVRMSDCFAFPSKREGLGIAALEGMASGLPVIGGNVGGVKDYIINDKTGFICTPNDADACSKRIKQMKSLNTKSYFLLVRGAIKKAYEFDIGRSNRCMKMVYQKISR